MIDINIIQDHNIKHKHIILGGLLKRWFRNTIRMPKEMEYQIKMRRAFMKLFLRKIRTTRRLKTFLFNQKINNINPKIYFISYIKKKIRMQNKNDNFKNQLRKNIHYKSFFERFTNVDLNSQPFTKFVLLIIFNNFNLIRKE